METESSLPRLKEPTSCHYPEPDQSSPCLSPPVHFMKTHFNIIFPSTPRSPKWFFPLGHPTKTLYPPLLSPIAYVMSSDQSESEALWKVS